ncbi:unnamed protein product, partial [Vitis vinifera]
MPTKWKAEYQRNPLWFFYESGISREGESVIS